MNFKKYKKLKERHRREPLSEIIRLQKTLRNMRMSTLSEDDSYNLDENITIGYHLAISYLRNEGKIKIEKCESGKNILDWTPSFQTYEEYKLELERRVFSIINNPDIIETILKTKKELL